MSAPGDGVPDRGGGELSSTGHPSLGARRGEELYRELARQLPSVAVLVFDHDLRLMVAVGEALTAYALRGQDAEGQLVGTVMAAGLYAELEEPCRSALAGERWEIDQTSEDSQHHFRVFGRPLHDEDGGVWAALVLAQDVTKMRSREAALSREAERLAHLATHDELTGLPNRALFHDRLEHALTRAQRDGRGAVVIFLDIDRFKNVNDTLGHDAGDQLLRAVGKVLSAGLRATDTVARLGGDEFAMLLEDTDDLAVGHVLDRIESALTNPVTIDGQEMLIRMSAGVASGPFDGTTTDEVLAAADRAMYQAKEAGGGAVRVYDPELQERSRERLRLETELHRALQRDELVAHYLPAIDVETGRVVSVEALVRWNHPTRGLLPPAAFIPLAEQTGQAAEITEWMLDQACEQINVWQQAGVAPLRVAVNTCPNELSNGLSASVRDALQRADISGAHLEIEITERFLGEDDNVTDAMLAELRSAGVTITIDDFGTGYSSLGRLRKLPIDVLKIDRTFVAELEEAPAVADTIITLGRNLGLTVIAEGVETEFQHHWLREAGCDAAAGFLFCRPRPPADLTPWLLAQPGGMTG